MLRRLTTLALALGLALSIPFAASAEPQERLERIHEAMNDDEVTQELEASEKEFVQILSAEAQEHYLAQDRDYANQALDRAEEILDI
ncbi:hypothetical protein M0534_11215 [Methylonatrum kenyense]|uniref:hypothetical protein n=1 Tax=Methylonatrum kenyense TaxID=455253 RepID=UPI0020BE93FD|nr:hypothetical protein [Methylonatrum kenyense]MCK8516888.1 hypothetical protein [Methylonatrum kenyense]